LTISFGEFASYDAAAREGTRIVQDLGLLHIIDRPEDCRVTVVPVVCACGEHGPCPEHAS
jgi:hypothetical protein